MTREEIICNKCCNRGLEIKQKLVKRSKLLSQVFMILKTIIHNSENDNFVNQHQSPMFKFQKNEQKMDHGFPATIFKSFNDFKDINKNVPSCDSASVNLSKKKSANLERNFNTVSKIHPEKSKNKELCFSTNIKFEKNNMPIFFTNQKTDFLNKDLVSLVNNNLQWGNNALKNETESFGEFLSELSKQIKLILNLLKVEILGFENNNCQNYEVIPNNVLIGEISRLNAEMEFYRNYSDETERKLNFCEQEILNLLKTAMLLKENANQKNDTSVDQKSFRRLSYDNVGDEVSTPGSSDHSRAVESLKRDFRLANNEIEKLKNEQSILFERNKMLKSWNEQAIEFKEKTSEELEKLKYEKFAMMKKYDEDFDTIREKQERLFGCWKQAEKEKEALISENQGLNVVLKCTKDQNTKLVREIEHHSAIKTILDCQISELNLKMNEKIKENQTLNDKNSNSEILIKSLQADIKSIKIELNTVINERKVTISEFISRNESLSNYTKKLNEIQESQSSKVSILETEKLKLDNEFETLSKSHQKMFEKFKKTKQTKDAIYSKFVQLSDQANFCFNIGLQ